jgi:hypothetical protein
VNLGEFLLQAFSLDITFYSKENLKIETDRGENKKSKLFLSAVEVGALGEILLAIVNRVGAPNTFIPFTLT